jgi:hypothetical protein
MGEPEFPRFTIEEAINRQYRGFSAARTYLTVRLLPPTEGKDSNPMSHLLASVSDLFEHALQNCDELDMVGITISNEENVDNKTIGLSFRKRDWITPDVVWSVFGKVANSNVTFKALDKLVLNIHYVKILIGNEGDEIPAKCRPLANMIYLKIVLLKLKLKITIWPTP